MKKITLSLTLVLFISIFTSHAQTWGPAQFTTSNLNGLSNGSTINLTAGTYTLTSAILTAWSSGTKNNVSFIANGAVTMDARGIKETGKLPRLTFSNWTNFKLEGIKFQNISLEFDGCTGSTMKNLILTDQDTNRGTTNFTDKKKSPFSIIILNSSNCIITNTTVNWNYQYENGKGIKVNGGTNNQFTNNTLTGRLTMGMAVITGKKSTTSTDPVTNHIINGGSVTRTGSVAAATEDHGIYIHNIANVTVNNVTFDGWSDTAAGHGIKIKGAWNIEVLKCTFKGDGGIIIREASNWENENKNFWIHDNTFENFGIGSYGLDGSPGMYGSIRINRNDIDSGTIKMNNETSVVNGANLSGKPGGVHDNCTSTAVSLDNTINESNNGIDCNVVLNIEEYTTALEQAIRIYPNPNNGRFTLLNHSNTNDDSLERLDIYTASGKLIAKTVLKGFNNNNIDINLPNNIKPGIYWLKISSKKSISTKKIVIK